MVTGEHHQSVFTLTTGSGDWTGVCLITIIKIKSKKICTFSRVSFLVAVYHSILARHWKLSVVSCTYWHTVGWSDDGRDEEDDDDGGSRWMAGCPAFCQSRDLWRCNVVVRCWCRWNYLHWVLCLQLLSTHRPATTTSSVHRERCLTSS